MISIACLSQKGGVGKSTLARLIATTYANGGWNVKIADFNVKQQTCVSWSGIRTAQNVSPPIAAEPFNDVIKAIRIPNIDMVVFDGKPDSDTQTINIAKEADAVVIPTGVSADDLMPQVTFAQELQMRGVPVAKIFFVINKATDSAAAIEDARNYIEGAGFQVADAFLHMKTAYVNAQNTGRTLTETEFPSLNARAEHLAQEIINHVNSLTQVPA